MNKEIFIKLERKLLIKILVEGDIVILDNAGFHKDGRRLLKKSGCGLWYLPPYLSDLNPI